MLVSKILSNGFAVAGKDFNQWPEKEMAIAWLNICISEALPYENSIRDFDKLPLVKAPIISNISEDLDFSLMITNVALCYGISSFIYADLQDVHTSQLHRNRFIAALEDASVGVEASIQDYY